MVDVLYSLVDVNERFDQLILDHLYIRHLNMTTMTIKSAFDRIFSINNQVLSRICENIFPRIHDQVNQLTIDSHSIDRLLTFNYPQLYSLSLVDFQENILLQYLKGNSNLYNLLSKQITHLYIDIEIKTRKPPLTKILPKIFVLILSLCKRLIYLNLCASPRYRCLAIHFFKQSSTSCMSSTLTTLNINVETFDDCLYLLDERLNSLLTLIICVKQLPKLKSFSLASCGKLDKVRSLMMLDLIYPFEHNFFQVISQDFPFLKELYILNSQRQQNKQHWSTLITFRHLIFLDLEVAHIDYVEQFLIDKNTHLPCLLNLIIGYESLAIVTNNFTNDAARLTCSKLKCLEISEPFVPPENFHQYFPLL
ncbi:unnamed protein product [Rotaria sp. Silwood1]|nr:unnamed protein product [Rotaria sp. Silwood1]